MQSRAIAAYQAGASGAGITVGVIDSGVDASSPEFAGRISGQSGDFAGGRELGDDGGHGTAVSAVLLAAKNDIGQHGVAWGATLLALRTDTPGSCSATDDECAHADNAIARGLDRAVVAGARVVNMSLGGSPANAQLRASIDRATAAGIVIVISAGNEGVKDPAAAVNPDPLAQTALLPQARGLILITGATDTALQLADFSNRAGNSAAFYLTALGVRVRAIDQTGTTFNFSGTSFAAPVVAGAAALLAQAFPSLTGAQIVDLLRRTATDLGAPGVDSIYGNGEVNIERAFAPQGSLSLADSKVAVSPIDNATLGGAMGDAGQGGLSTTVRDSYGRAYAADLSPTIHARAVRPRLAAALLPGALGLAGEQGGAQFSLAVADDRVERLRLTPGEARSARALAASVTARIDARTSLALGYAQRGEALARILSGCDEAAFLIAGGTGGDALDARPQAAFAVRRSVGAMNLSFAVERGALQHWDDLSGMQRRGYGSASLGVDVQRGAGFAGVRLTRLDEADTVLGSRFGSALGGGGATSWFGDVETGASFGPWRVGAAWREGRTSVGAAPGRRGSTLASRALSVDLARTGIAMPGDRFALRWSQPLRVTGGGLDLAAFDGLLDLVPRGRERVAEAVYARPLGRGWLTGNAYLRQQPGNIAAAADDLGVALRFALLF